MERGWEEHIVNSFSESAHNSQPPLFLYRGLGGGGGGGELEERGGGFVMRQRDEEAGDTWREVIRLRGRGWEE